MHMLICFGAQNFDTSIALETHFNIHKIQPCQARHRDRWEPIAGLLKLVYETPVKGYEIIGKMMINQGVFEGFSRKFSDQNVGLDATWQFWGG